MKLRLPQSDLRLLEMITPEDPALAGALNIQRVSEGAHEYAKTLSEISHRGKFTGARGFDAGFHFQHVASIPQSVIAALVLIDPDIMTVKEKFYGWLAGPGRVWDVRRRTVKGV